MRVKFPSFHLRGRWPLLFLTGLAAFLSSGATAQPLILDEEFNQFATQLIAPLRATLVPNRAVHFVLVNDPTLNAFVTAENLVYLHTGLVAQAKTAAELQGVLAHELGHLAAGHLDSRALQSRQALLPVLAGALVGAGAAVAGAPQVAVAAVLTGQAAGIQTILNFSRTQEAEADQRALAALNGAKLSAQGMVGLFHTLRTQSQLSYDSPPPWLVSHPLPAARLAQLTASVATEKPALTGNLAAQEKNQNWARIQAKVAALSQTPTTTLRRFAGAGTETRYARTIAYLAQGKLAEAEGLLATLRQATPQDPYLMELAAQLALAQGNLPVAASLFGQALQKVPNGLLLRYQLAEVLRAQGKAKEAGTHYLAITRAWPIWADPWEGLGKTLGQQGALAQSHLAFTEAALANGKHTAAQQSLALAKNYLLKKPEPETAAWAVDLTTRLEALKK